MPGSAACPSRWAGPAATVYAAEAGHTAAVRLTLDLGSPGEARGGGDGSTALHAAAYSGSVGRADRSAGPLVGAYGERREDDEDPGQPHQALPQVRLDRAAERQRAHGVDDVGDRLVVGERLQPAGHGPDRHERGAEERDREQPDQAERLHRLLVADGQAGERGDDADS